MNQIVAPVRSNPRRGLIQILGQQQVVPGLIKSAASGMQDLLNHHLLAQSKYWAVRLAVTDAYHIGPPP